jgi:hypothetical protein
VRFAVDERISYGSHILVYDAGIIVVVAIVRVNHMRRFLAPIPLIMGRCDAAKPVLVIRRALIERQHVLLRGRLVEVFPWLLGLGRLRLGRLVALEYRLPERFLFLVFFGCTFVILFLELIIVNIKVQDAILFVDLNGLAPWRFGLPMRNLVKLEIALSTLPLGLVDQLLRLPRVKHGFVRLGCPAWPKFRLLLHLLLRL